MMRVQVQHLIDRGVLTINDGYRAKNTELGLSGVPFARAGNLNNGFRFDGGDHLVKSRVPLAGEKVSRAGDVVFTSKGTVGRFGFVRQSTPVFIYSPQLCYWRVLDRNQIEPQWLYYWMHGRECDIQLSAMKGQTDMADYVNLRDQRRMFISLPSIARQRAVAAVLGALDEKIELNRLTNETLEGMARAIFKSWFVDFDPVRAKAEGRQPGGMHADTATLFPAAFQSSEIGHIPQGWRVSRWGDIATLEYGKSLRSYSAVGRYRVYGTNGPIGWHSDFIWDGPGVIVGRKGAYRGVHYSPAPFFVIDTAFYLRPTVPLSILWAYYELLNLDINSMDSGSAIPSTSREDFKQCRVVAPPHHILAAFDRTVLPMYASITARTAESETLAAIRDTLLPKLLSGEVRIRDAERAIEAHV